MYELYRMSQNENYVKETIEKTFKYSCSSKSERYRPLAIQWHITDKCNLRCKHCHQEQYSSKELSKEQLMNVFSQFEELLGRIRHYLEVDIPCRLNIAGGEPFLRRDFFDILKDITQKSHDFKIGILTNGIYLSERNVEKVKMCNVNCVQVFLEGKESTHDSVRGIGAYKKAIDGIKLLNQYGIRSSISFTANRGNFREFIDVVKLGVELGVSSVWTERCVPHGVCNQSRLEAMNADETKEYIEIVKTARNMSSEARKIMNNLKALQFLGMEDDKESLAYHCIAGRNFITVMADGVLVPCRRLPIHVGNILNHSLSDLYFSSPQLLKLRNYKGLPKECEACEYKDVCGGGLRCLSFATYNDPFKVDPGCWIRSESN